jgi:ribosome silencing factor RsfS/YbeB/iojap
LTKLILLLGGVAGVFEIKDLVDVLNREKARDLCVIKLPAELKYVDYFCIVNGISYRHMIGMANFVRKCYKLKRHSGDIIPKIEGELSKDWICMDLGNIALHIFTEEKRKYYDLESLWCLGEEYENRIKNKDKKKAELYQSYLHAASSPISSTTPINPEKLD